MKVFLTGGSGYIGRAVITELIGQGHSVQALTRSDQARTVVEKLGADAVPSGLTDLDVLTTAAAEADAVIHLAQADSGDIDLAAATAMQDGVGAGTYVHTGGTQPVEAAVLGRADQGGRPVIVQPGLLYGGDNRLIDQFFAVPGERGAREQMGPIADAFALDQQLTSSRAQTELGWTPHYTDPLAVLSHD